MSFLFAILYQKMTKPYFDGSVVVAVLLVLGILIIFVATLLYLIDQIELPQTEEVSSCLDISQEECNRMVRRVMLDYGDDAKAMFDNLGWCDASVAMLLTEHGQTAIDAYKTDYTLFQGLENKVDKTKFMETIMTYPEVKQFYSFYGDTNAVSIVAKYGQEGLDFLKAHYSDFVELMRTDSQKELDYDLYEEYYKKVSNSFSKLQPLLSKYTLADAMEIAKEAECEKEEITDYGVYIFFNHPADSYDVSIWEGVESILGKDAVLIKYYQDGKMIEKEYSVPKEEYIELQTYLKSSWQRYHGKEADIYKNKEEIMAMTLYFVSTDEEWETWIDWCSFNFYRDDDNTKTKCVEWSYPTEEEVTRRLEMAKEVEC